MRTIRLCKWVSCTILLWVSMTMATMAQESRINIFAIGDSITWGQTFGSGNDYPRVIQQKMNNHGLDQVRVSNYGVSGYTVGDILNTWQSQQRIFTRMDVQFITIMLGTNDTRVGDETPLEVYVQRMNALIDIFVNVTNSDGSHPQVILSLIPPHNSPKDGEYMASNFKDRFIYRDRIPNELNPALIQIGEERGLLVVDCYTPLKEAGPDILPDGLHPAQEGNAMLAETLYEALLPLIEKPASVESILYESLK